MARILSLEHWSIDFDYDNADFFAGRGDVLESLRIYAGEKPPDPRDHDLVIVYGGEMSAYDDRASPWIARELRFLEECMKAGTSLFGICLGSQLLARLLGARVYRSEKPEFGFKRLRLNDEGLSDPVLGALGAEGRDFLAIQWHDDAWDLPSGARLLASSEAWPNQAFRYGPKVLGIQFHLEFTQPHMARAVSKPDWRESADPRREDRAAFAAPGPRYAEVRKNMEQVLERLLADPATASAQGAVAASRAAR